MNRATSLILCALARPVPEGAVILGATVQTLAAEPADGAAERWVELAYAVSMVESDITLSREDFDRCVENFKRYPCVPVVIEHADTDWFGDREWAEPHGHVEELRVGEREVADMNGVARTAATLEGRVSFDAATAPTVGAGRKWRFGSITIIKGAVDEATGAGLGAMLWSWSLTAHPRLTGLTPIAAGQRLGALPPELAAQVRAALAQPLPQQPATPPTPRGAAASPTTENPMKFSLILAALGMAAVATEDEAEKRVTAAAQFGLDALKAVGLPPTATPAEYAAKVSELLTASAKVPTLQTELDVFRADAAKRTEADRSSWINDLVAARPELVPARASLEMHAERDWAGFQTAYPRPSVAELSQRAQDPQRAAVVVTHSNDAPKPVAPAAPNAEVQKQVAALRQVYADHGYELTTPKALDLVSRGETPESAARALQNAG